MAGQGFNVRGKFLPLNSGPADAQDPKGSKADNNPFVASRLNGGDQKKKKKKRNKAQQDAIARRLSQKSQPGGKGSGRN